MNNKLIWIVLGIAILSWLGCSYKVSSSCRRKLPAHDLTTSVVSYGLTDTIPLNAEVIGNIKIGEFGFTTKCSWQDALEKAKQETNKLGGNAFRITKHLPPSFFSSCHRIRAEILLLSDTIITERTLSIPKEIVLPKRRLSIAGGIGKPIFDKSLGTEVVGTSGTYQNYLLQNRNGNQFSVNFDYFFSRRFGLGVTYNRFWLTAGQTGVDIVLPSDSLIYVDLKNQIRLEYYGAFLRFRNIIWQGKGVVNMGVGLGSLNYSDQQTFETNYTISGATIGAVGEIELDFFVSDHLAVGAQWQALNGTLREYKKTDEMNTENITLAKGNYLDISRINLSLALHYYW